MLGFTHVGFFLYDQIFLTVQTFKKRGSRFVYFFIFIFTQMAVLFTVLVVVQFKMSLKADTTEYHIFTNRCCQLLVCRPKRWTEMFQKRVLPLACGPHLCSVWREHGGQRSPVVSLYPSAWAKWSNSPDSNEHKSALETWTHFLFSRPS